MAEEWFAWRPVRATIVPSHSVTAVPVPEHRSARRGAVYFSDRGKRRWFWLCRVHRSRCAGGWEYLYLVRRAGEVVRLLCPE